MHSIVQLLSLPVELLYMIIHCCCIPTLLRLCATCHFLDLLISKELPLRHRLLLTRFVGNVRGLKRELTHTGSIVAASGALWVNDEPECFHLNDLDIVCPIHLSFHMVGYLHYVEGYTIVRLFGVNVDGNLRGGVRSIVRMSNGDKLIDVIQSQAPTSMFPLFSLWSSIPMSFFNEHSIYIAYPRLLEQCRGILNPARLVTIALPDLLEKYHNRGFKICQSEASWLSDDKKQTRLCRLDQNPYCPQTKRAVGDRWGLQTRLGTIDERMGQAVFEGPIADWTVVWQRRGHPCGALCSAYEGFSIPMIFYAPLIRWV